MSIFDVQTIDRARFATIDLAAGGNLVTLTDATLSGDGTELKLKSGERRRIEMRLASCKRQKVRVAGRAIEFRAGETIHTENSYKYTIDSFQALARGSGWSPLKVWTDGLFSVHALVNQTTDDR